MDPYIQTPDVDDPTNLQKLLRLQTKNMNFQYSDESSNQTLKVAHPNILNSWKQFQHPLQVFWLNIHNIYLRKLNQSEKQRLTFIKQLSKKQVQESLPFEKCQRFWSTIKLYIKPSYVEKSLKASKKDLYFENWFLILYHHFEFFINAKSKTKKALNKQFYSELQRVRNFSLSSIKSVQNLKKEKKLLINLNSFNNQTQSEVDQELKVMSSELKEVNKRNSELFQHLFEGIQRQQKLNKIIYVGQNQQQFKKCSDEKTLLQKAQETATMKKYLEYEIRKFEKKQISDSLYKLINVEKRSDEYFYTVLFDESMGYGQVVLSQPQLLKMDKFRQISIFDGYQSGIKSRFNFIYSNLTGFNELYLNYGNPCKFEVQKYNMFRECKKQKKYPKKIVQKFKEFEMCHQCQAIFEPKYLKSCEYSSVNRRCSSRKIQEINSYVQQIRSIIPDNFKETIQNRFENYLYSKGVYVCKRKFCVGCVKDYEEIFKNGLCYFCQNICQCARCLRNKRINKFKKIYHSLGGFVSQAPFQNFLKNQENVSEKENLSAKRVTEKEKKQKFGKIRRELDHLRLLSDLIKTREKKKLKILEIEDENFKAILKNIDFLNISGRKVNQEDKRDGINKKDKENSSSLRKKRNLSAKPVLCFK